MINVVSRLNIINGKSFLSFRQFDKKMNLCCFLHTFKWHGSHGKLAGNLYYIYIYINGGGDHNERANSPNRIKTNSFVFQLPLCHFQSMSIQFNFLNLK